MYLRRKVEFWCLSLKNGDGFFNAACLLRCQPPLYYITLLSKGAKLAGDWDHVTSNVLTEYSYWYVSIGVRGSVQPPHISGILTLGWENGRNALFLFYTFARWCSWACGSIFEELMVKNV